MDLSKDLIGEYSIVSSENGLEDSDDKETLRESFGAGEVVEEDDDLAVTLWRVLAIFLIYTILMESKNMRI